jgi:hypothetical protein
MLPRGPKIFPSTIDRSMGAKTSTTKAATFKAASMSRPGEMVTLNSSPVMAITAPRIFAPRDRGLPFNSIFILQKRRGKGERRKAKKSPFPRRSKARIKPGHETSQIKYLKKIFYKNIFIKALPDGRVDSISAFFNYRNEA